MAIKRFIATKDTTITNALKSSLSTSGSTSNMGAADSLQVFSIHGQTVTTTGSNNEKSRILLYFNASEISSSIATPNTSGTIPSGTAEYYLRMFNVEHHTTLPKNYKLAVYPLTTPFTEGTGLDMDEFGDLGAANWLTASAYEYPPQQSLWTVPGGDWDGEEVYTQYFDGGQEDLEINITELVRQWTGGELSNYGVVVRLSGSYETRTQSFYKKMFSSRSSEYFFKRPTIEARWDSSKGDDTGNFYLSSSLADANSNLNGLYLFNYVKGQLQDLPDVIGAPVLTLWSGTLGGGNENALISFPKGGDNAVNNASAVLSKRITTGIYSASFAYTGSATTIIPVWRHITAGNDGVFGNADDAFVADLFTGSTISVKKISPGNYDPTPRYTTSIKNLKDVYSSDESPNLRVFIRKSDWNPNVYTKVQATQNSEIIERAYYKVYRAVDNYDVITYGTGTAQHTKMGYDVSGSYFDFDMSMLESGYMYGFKFMFYYGGAYLEQPETFKFRVE